MQEIFEKHGLLYNEKLIQDFEKFLELFIEWNSKINLSALREKDDIILKHFIDSLLITKIESFSYKKVLDLGTGGGFPALPLALYAKHIDKKNVKITALDARQKKIRVVEDMAQQLGLCISPLAGRAEDFATQQKYREQFDIVLTRAFAPLPVLLELALPFLKVGGKLIAYQGPAIKQEIPEGNKIAHILGGEDALIETIPLDDNIERIFLSITKIKNTPKLYPRPNGVPTKNPLSV